MAQKNNSFRQSWMVGLTLVVPMILVIGPFAGYLIGSVLKNSFSTPPFLTPALIGIGFVASAIQSCALIQHFNDLNKK